ncbi:MAG: hypothetical protein ACM3NN_02935 [Nitrospirota bacterium]
MKPHRMIGFVWLWVLTTSFVALGVPTTNPTNSSTTPLTFANAVSFFKAAKFRAIEVQPRCAIFFEGEWKTSSIYNYCVIMVENSDQDIQVTFYLTDAHEMNWVTEFLDSQFFKRTETEKLFQMMNARKDVRGQNMGRFRVDFHHWQPRHAELLIFSFTPLRGAR